MKRLLSALLFIFFLTTQVWANSYTLTSPDGTLRIDINAGNQLSWSIKQDATTVLLSSPISMKTSIGTFGQKMHNIRIRKNKTKDYNAIIVTQKNYSIEFRAYNDAATYRFSTGKESTKVYDEQSEFHFNNDYNIIVPYVNDCRSGERWCYSFESYYDKQKLSQMYNDSLAISPMAVCLPNGKKAVLMEADVENYPGMYLVKGDGNSLCATFPHVPTASKTGGYNHLNLVPTSRAEYIAKNITRLPWRVVVVTRRDYELIGNDIAQRLGSPCRIQDTSWIHPGKVAWDWWNNSNVSGVDFRAGINTETYKYFADFAKNNHLEYMIVDEGWSSPEDLMVFSDKMDIPEIIRYANQQGVGVILWSSWRNLIQHGHARMEEIMSHYESLGVKGFKVDFFDRDDQESIRSCYELAECAAKHHLLLDLHGMRPFGIQNTYPNVINFEGVKGLENSKWEPRNGNGPLHDQPMYDCEIPFLRNLIGPMDYTPGAMTNATKSQFFGNNDHPMSQGTRVHQMAMYVVFNAPLQMLADSPTRYMQNQECTDFISQIPTVWDETIPLAGEIGQYVAVARRNGKKWYIGILNNWQERDITIDLTPLKADAQIEVFADGINADREATDYKYYDYRKEGKNIEKQIKVHLAPGGGYAAILR
jgi:alpha-glucosidase